ncbi:MAG: hypothetical protein ACLR4A_06970 [Christensenellales bacterium]
MTADERALLERKMREAGTANMGAYLRKMALDGYILRLDLPELKRYFPSFATWATMSTRLPKERTRSA